MSLPHLLFFFSGLSGLIYQVIWVRAFGNIFGNTVYSASLVVAVFMLGLGVGSVIAGRIADRQYRRGTPLLRTFGLFECAIGVLGLAAAWTIPYSASVSALISTYSQGAEGWYFLSVGSELARAALAIVMLAPATTLMGGTLTLLIRSLVAQDLRLGNRHIALLYAINTAGAAVGAFVADFALVPRIGLTATQFIAVLGNICVGITALLAARRAGGAPVFPAIGHPPVARQTSMQRPPAATTSSLAWTSLALALSGFAAMGIEIVWFRHFTLLLGGFRAVFSMLLAVILGGIGIGSAIAAALIAWRREDATRFLMLTQALVAAFTLLGMARVDLQSIQAAAATLLQTLGRESVRADAFAEVWLNARPMLLAAAIPAMLMGLAFPLGNAVIQRLDHAVARRAGILYLANTIGAVCGSLAAGFVLLPALGIQQSAGVLASVAVMSVVPMYLSAGQPRHRDVTALAVATAIGVGSVALWLRLPRNEILLRAHAAITARQHLVHLSEGVNEAVMVLDVPDQGRQLLTNGHPMSSTGFMSQRYMRALAHIPLLSMQRPEHVLIIGFGVGNTAHAVSLYRPVKQIDVADLSTEILRQAGYFDDANRHVLADPRVAVYVNDGRQHLRMQPPGSYDLITLEPPPLMLSGVGALYSKEFYELAHSRLTPTGYLSQWLPAYQVSEGTLLSMIRAFIDVFPQSVLLSGAGRELLLIGTRADRIEIDPDAIQRTLSDEPAVAADLNRVSLGTPREVVGTFLASPEALQRASRDADPASDDRPVQEYDAKSRVTTIHTAPLTGLYATDGVSTWCPKCFVDGAPAASVRGLSTYLALVDRLGGAPAADAGTSGQVDAELVSMVRNSQYLQLMLPEAHALLGEALAAEGRLAAAVAEFRRDVARQPGSSAAHRRLGDALVEVGSVGDGIEHLRRATELRPDDPSARYDFGTALLAVARYQEAAEQFTIAARQDPNVPDIHNNLGISLASLGRLDEAIAAFERALRLAPGFASARQNLSRAIEEANRARRSR